MRHHNLSKAVKSQHFRDPFKAIILGYSERINSTMGAENLFLEARDLQGFFEPYRNSMQRSLAITHPDSEVVKLLEAHFLDRGHEWNLGIDLNFVHRLMHLFGYMHENATFFGRSYCEIVWDEVEIRGDRKWILPIELSLIPTETMRRKFNGQYIQKYSLITRLKVFGPYDYKSVRFEEDEILEFKWPFGFNTVWERIRYIYKTRYKYMQHGVTQAEASALPGKNSYRLLKASRSSHSKWKFQYITAQLKVKRIMRLPGYVENFSPTKFYDAFLVYRCLIDKARALNLYIEVFNQQVMTNIAKKNNWGDVPQLTYRGKYQERLISDLYDKFLRKEITYESFIKEVSEND